MSEQKTRYTKEELEEFRKIIEDKLRRARQDLEELRESLRSTNEEDHFVEFMDIGASLYEKEQLGYMIHRMERFINDLERALVRIENGTYGICKVTGKLIPKERLRLVPHTEMTVEAKKQQYTKRLEDE